MGLQDFIQEQLFTDKNSQKGKPVIIAFIFNVLERNTETQVIYWRPYWNNCQWSH